MKIKNKLYFSRVSGESKIKWNLITNWFTSAKILAEINNTPTICANMFVSDADAVAAAACCWLLAIDDIFICNEANELFFFVLLYQWNVHKILKCLGKMNERFKLISIRVWSICYTNIEHIHTDKNTHTRHAVVYLSKTCCMFFFGWLLLPFCLQSAFQRRPVVAVAKMIIWYNGFHNATHSQAHSRSSSNKYANDKLECGGALNNEINFERWSRTLYIGGTRRTVESKQTKNKIKTEKWIINVKHKLSENGGCNEHRSVCGAHVTGLSACEYVVCLYRCMGRSP